jgi:hypothetical protein
MRKTLLLTMILFTLSAWVVAQQQPNSQSAPSSSQGTAQSSAGQNTVQGCLGGSGNTFTVTDKSGTSYQLQLPQGADPTSLKPHIGEEVRVEGTTSSGSGASSGGSAAGQPTITVKNIYRVSTTCSTKGTGGTPKSQ